MKDLVRYNGATDEQVQWGGNDDPREYLKEGETYEVLKTVLHNWHTKIMLKEFPNLWFNTSSFTTLIKSNNVFK